MTALAGWQNFYIIVGSSAGCPDPIAAVVLTNPDCPMSDHRSKCGRG